MHIWEEEKQCYIKAAMERNSLEENALLKKRLDQIDWTVFDHMKRKETVNERGVFAPLAAVEIGEIRAREEEFRKIGLKTIREGKVGAVLLAGGQGTRLGLDKPKGTLNIGVNRELYLFEQLLRNLMDVTEEAGVSIPLYIMTSNINGQDTMDFLEKHAYFGYSKEYIKFFVQEMEPACDYEGRVYMESNTEPVMSPNGNGGWFGSMVNAGLLADIRARGIEWINVFAVDNCLQRIADPLFVGATIAYGCESGAKVVKKAAPDERIGVLCKENGKPSIVEYYEMTEEMATARKENGELSYSFGVILNYLFSEKKLEEIANAKMPIHVVEKQIPYIDLEGNERKPEKPNGYKFETLVLDMVHMMENCLPYEVERDREFAPIKNLHGVDSLDTARELLQKCGVKL
ncbi:MAG: UTP--glucose-1-phosphate uridylyltransferase [Clostridiales bacterium]|nr:UTP--glucose-1-phosphate uridylyltransferase [Clostridiales bacterium]